MRLLTNLFKTLLILVLLAALALLGAVLLWQGDLRRVDDLNVLEYGGKATVVDASGQVIGALTPALSSGARVNRDLLKQNEMSSWVRKAVVTSEDTRFYEHGAIDPRGLLRALFRSATGDVEGGSTITQQVVKNTLLADLDGARTANRKLKEALLAVQVERRFSKEEILTAYLNVAYWGAGRTDLIGVQDAARAYFREDASQLNLAQSVYLATLLPSPRRYNDYPAYRPLMHDLLSRMVEAGRATQAQADAAWRYPLRPAGWTVRYDGRGNLTSARLSDPGAKRRNSPAPQVRFADGFLDAVERDLEDRLGRSVLYRSGVTVYTTMSRQAQQAGEAASAQASIPNGSTLGLALLDPQTGDVRALVGQKLGDGVLEEWNNATRARRQVGSSIKPLLYTLALSEGWKQSDTVLDAPLSGDYQPQNYSGSYTGRRVTLRYALDHSLNLPTVRLAQQVGLDKLAAKLRELGLSPGDNAGLPLAIGALEASPLQMAAAYAPFANGGLYHEPRLITRVTEGSKVLLTVDPSPAKRVWDEQTAWLGLDLIRGVVNDLTPREGGLGWNARIDGREVGGKTGTTNDVRDLWFAGVTPGLSGAVWVGRSDNAPLPQTAYSGDVAAPVWQSAVAGALAGQPVAEFTEPSGIGYARVRGLTMAFRQDEGGGLSDLFRGSRRNGPPRDQQDQAAPDGSAQDGQDGSADGQDQQAAQDQTSPDQTAPDQTNPDQTSPDQAAQDGSAQDGSVQAAPDQAGQDQSGQGQGQTQPDPSGSGQATQESPAAPATPYQTQPYQDPSFQGGSGQGGSGQSDTQPSTGDQGTQNQGAQNQGSDQTAPDQPQNSVPDNEYNSAPDQSAPYNSGAP